MGLFFVYNLRTCKIAKGSTRHKNMAAHSQLKKLVRDMVVFNNPVRYKQWPIFFTFIYPVCETGGHAYGIMTTLSQSKTWSFFSG